MIYVNVRAIIERVEDGKHQISLQTRDKQGERQQLELPGGRLEPYESLLDGLKREVQEETGLELVEVKQGDTYLRSVQDDMVVESIVPFAVYQTVQGPVDSMGVYFRCTAQGELLQQGDEAKKAHFLDVNEVMALIETSPDDFSWVDLAGLRQYIRFVKETHKSY